MRSVILHRWWKSALVLGAFSLPLLGVATVPVSGTESNARAQTTSCPEQVVPNEPRDDQAQPSASVPLWPITVQVSGTARYYDVEGKPHAIRCAQVEVVDNIDAGHEISMGKGFTDHDGHYQITARGGDLFRYPNIQVHIFSNAPAFVKVLRLRGNGYSTFFLQSKQYNNYTHEVLLVEPLSTGVPQYGSQTDDLEARAFSVFDAMVQAGSQGRQLVGGPLPQLTVYFPSSETSYLNPGMKVLRQDALAWDTLFHEYGHYLADNARSHFADPIQAKCSFFSAIPCIGKDQGIRFAWSEGWATYVGISLQTDPLGGLVQPKIPWAGDQKYDFVEDHPNLPPPSFDLETVSNGSICSNFGPKAGCGSSLGYASAFSVAGLFWDLQDPQGDRSKDSNATDTTVMSLREIWSLLNQGDYNEVGKFYNALVQGKSMQESLALGEAFALNNIGPELSAPKPAEHLNCQASPTFRWKANGDANAPYAHNAFVLRISKDQFQTSKSFQKITSTSTTIPLSDWEELLRDSRDGQELQWAVFGTNTVSPQMPQAPSPTEGFASGSQTLICDDLPPKELLLMMELAGAQGYGGGVALNGGVLRPFFSNGSHPGYQTNYFPISTKELVHGTNTLLVESPPTLPNSSDVWDDIQFHSMQIVDEKGIRGWDHPNTHHLGDQTIQGIWDYWLNGTWGDPNPPEFWVELEGQQLTISFEYPFESKAVQWQTSVISEPATGPRSPEFSVVEPHGVSSGF